MESIGSAQGFAIMNNVYIEVCNEKRHKIVKRFTTHNKATRKMVCGILAYLCGYFTKTQANPNIMYNAETANQFIPCYFNVGEGGVIHNDETGLPESNGSDVTVPNLDPNWNETVDYNATKLVKEFYVNVESETGVDDGRPKISYQKSTIIDDRGNTDTEPAPDMDSIYLECIIPPNQLNPTYGGNAVYVTELGLFAGHMCGKNDLLAYVKLGNYTEDGVVKTNALYVKPEDTIIIKWVISIAAIGKDNILKATITDENDEIIVSDILQIPTETNIEVEDVPDNQNNS